MTFRHRQIPARPLRRAASAEAAGSPPRPGHASPLAGVPVAAALVILVVALPLGGCGDSTTTPPLPPLISELTALRSDSVLWTTSLPSRGAVRWGLVSGVYDHLSYPSALTGEDREARHEHTVTLLEAPAGIPVYARRLDRTSDGNLHVAPEETLIVTRSGERRPRLEWTAIDVQFGDAHVLKLPTRGALVAIDAGAWYENYRGEPAPSHFRRWLEDRAVDSLAVAFATHVHADHYGGFLDSGGQPGLLKSFATGMFLDVPAVTGNERAWQRLQAAVDAEGIPRLVIEPGMTEASHPDRLRWDEQVRVAVLNAGAQPEWASSNINNDSIVLRISYGEVDLLAGGDAEKPAENRMLSRYPELLADIEWFKGLHHGRNDENTWTLLQVLQPRVCSIPVAFSAYGGYEEGLRQTAGTLSRLQRVGADAFRFDDAALLGKPWQDGIFWHVTFLTDGASYEVRVEPSIWGL